MMGRLVMKLYLLALLGMVALVGAEVAAQTSPVPASQELSLEAWRQEWFAYEREITAWCTKNYAPMRAKCLQSEMAQHGVSPAFFEKLRAEAATTSPPVQPSDTSNKIRLEELTPEQRQELFVFGARAMGLEAGVGDVKHVLSPAEVKQLVSAGIKLNGHLCAEIVEIRPLQMQAAYEVSCSPYRGDSGTKTYVLEAFEGRAFEP